jgi:hypothetical protein
MKHGKTLLKGIPLFPRYCRRGGKTEFGNFIRETKSFLCRHVIHLDLMKEVAILLHNPVEAALPRRTESQITEMGCANACAGGGDKGAPPVVLSQFYGVVEGVPGNGGEGGKIATQVTPGSFSLFGTRRCQESVDFRASGENAFRSAPYCNPDLCIGEFLPCGNNDRSDEQIVADMPELGEKNAHEKNDSQGSRG